jgi:hypothetical protein
VPLEGERTPRALLQTPFNEAWAQLSPDGRWMAYSSNESGRSEIYVRAFIDSATGAGGQWQVSQEGGIHPVWSPDGRELVYVAPIGTLMAAPIDVRGSAVDAGTPVALFRPRIVGGGIESTFGRQYDIARDGRFLINTLIEEAATAPITLLQHWRAPAR